MKKDVMISINGLQGTAEGSEDNITLVTGGTLSRVDGDYVIRYEESELTGMQGTVTTLNIGENTVTVTRTGQHPSQMMFEKGRRHNTLYHTNYGDLIVGVDTHHIFSDITESGGSLTVKYAIDIDNSIAGTNSLTVSVKNMDDAGRLFSGDAYC